MRLTQREKPGITPQQLNACMGLPIDSATLVSGGQFENFREGWAHYIMGDCLRSHYFIRGDFQKARPVCGGRARLVRWLYGPGNYKRCLLCAQRKSW